MDIDWLSLIAGLAFGLIPGIKLINCECRYMTFDDMRSRLFARLEPGRRRRRWWKMPLVWINPFRGYVTGWLIVGSIEPSETATVTMARVALVLTYVLIGVCVVMQTTGREDQDERLSPAGFMMGLVLAIFPPVVAVGLLAVGIATAWAASGYAAGYVAAALFAAGFGYLLDPGLPRLGMKVVIVALPLLTAWWCHSRLVTPVRA